MTKALATKPSGVLSKRLLKSAGKGNENVTKDDIIVPVLVLIQANSPQTIKKSDAYIEGCSAGDMINALTRENYGDILYIIPLLYKRTFREHEERKDDNRLGNFINEHNSYDIASLENNDKGFQCIVPDSGHEIVQTANDLVLILPNAKEVKGKFSYAGDAELIMIRCRFTKWRMAKQLNSLAKRLTLDAPNGSKLEAPRYAGVYKLSSEYVESAENPYYNWKVDFVNWNTEEDFIMAESRYDSIAGKSIKTAGDEVDDDGAGSSKF